MENEKRRAYLREYCREYIKDYRKEGFGKVNDRRYYMNHREELLAKQRERDRARSVYRKKLRETCEN